MRLALVFLVFLGGCASLDQQSCQRADWYDLGFRDAIFGLQRQDDAYAAQCERHGVTVDATRYAQGWQEGAYEADARKNGSLD